MKEKVILLVEDNPDDVVLTMRAFKQNKISNKVIVANDGVEARDYLLGEGPYVGRDAKDLPVLILLDLKLPRMDGLEFLRWLRRNERVQLIPVVILTSSGEENDLINGYKLGANSYVRKPVAFEQFIKAIKHLGIFWLLWNEPPPLDKLGEKNETTFAGPDRRRL